MGTIEVQGLSKAYKQYRNRWARLGEWLSPAGKEYHHKHWVLKDISFSVRRGEAVAIVGVNGAGKSTLLKMITGTTQPTEGSIRVDGRVAALLELGMGFHPEFTGRQNAYTAGQLLGLSTDDITSLMPHVEAFAQIGDYIDQPVRTYSSGMQVRLAFSLATAARPDILIVDEALSVGDAYFQHKSFDRIRSFREAGTTLLIVSHDRQTIQSICDRAILLDQGKVAVEGTPESVMDYYSALLADRSQATIRQEALAGGQVRTISGSGEAAVDDVELLDQHGAAVDVVEVGDAVRLRVRVRINADIPRLVMGFMIKDRMGQPVYGINTHRLERPLENLRAGERVTFCYDFAANIGKGNYSISISLSRYDSHLDVNYEWRDLALIFHVINTHRPDFVGAASLDAAVDIERTALMAADSSA